MGDSQKCVYFVVQSIFAVKKKSTLFNIKDLVVYFLVAGTGAVVQLATGSFFRNYYGFTTSVALGYLVSSVVGFFLTKWFAFDARNTNKTRREMIKFGIVVFISFGITTGGATLVNIIFYSLFGQQTYKLPFQFLPAGWQEININEVTATTIAMGFSFISNYILHKTFTFRSTGFYDRAKTALHLNK